MCLLMWPPRWACTILTPLPSLPLCLHMLVERPLLCKGSCPADPYLPRSCSNRVYSDKATARVIATLKVACKAKKCQMRGQSVLFLTYVQPLLLLTMRLSLGLGLRRCLLLLLRLGLHLQQ